MPRKFTDADWDAANKAYDAWDHKARNAPKLEEVLAPYGMSKQGFLSQRHREGLPLKTSSHLPTYTLPPDPSVGPGVAMLVELLVEARMKVRTLESILDENNIPHP